MAMLEPEDFEVHRKDRQASNYMQMIRRETFSKEVQPE
jgi:hypothetical protein